jgi:putative heme-binding domain-containing protein
LEDLVPDLANAAIGRNLENGKKLFTQMACGQCHKLGKEGYAYGPDLTGVLARYKGDRSAVLQQILDPSKVIEDRYRNISFELKGGEPVTGMVMKEDDHTITIHAGPSDALVQKLNKAEIIERKPQPYSLMPAGLLNSLSRNQIFDLLAFVLSAGDAKSHAHQH